MEERTATERWRQMPERVRPEDQRPETPAGPPPGNQVISGDAPEPLPNG